MLALAPQSNDALGLEVLAVSVPAIVVSNRLLAQALVAAGRRSPFDSRRLVAAIGTVPMAIGAISLILEAGGGFYWLAAAVVAALVGSVLNAWVYLVEILR